MNTEDRLLREKEFHNETFSSDTRKAAKKYYRSASISKEYYKSSIFENIEGKKVLEYGCGPGSLALDLAKCGAEVFAIDISDVAIEQIKAKAESEGLHINCSVMDAEALTYDDDYFDVICGSGILHHLDLQRSYKELHRTLKKSGKAVFFEPLGHNPIINLYRNLTPKMRTDDEHPLLMKDISMSKQLFGEVKTKHFNLFATLGSFIPFLNSPLNVVDSWIFGLLPFLKKHSWIVVLEFSKPK